MGAGDYPREPEALGEPYPDATSRIEAVGETVAVLRRVWSGERDSIGTYVKLSRHENARKIDLRWR